MDIAPCDYQQDLEPYFETVDFLLRLVVVIMVGYSSLHTLELDTLSRVRLIETLGILERSLRYRHVELCLGVEIYQLGAHQLSAYLA